MYAATSGGGGLDDSILSNWDKGDNYDDGSTTSKSLETQQKRADSAWNEVRRRVRQLTGEEPTEADRQVWHRRIGELHGRYHEILREGLRMFGCGQ
jgi:hypothetical protein